MQTYRRYTITTDISAGAFHARIWREDGRRFRMDGQTFEVYETMTRFDQDDAIDDARKAIDRARLVPIPKPQK